MYRPFTDLEVVKEEVRLRADLVSIVQSFGIELNKKGERWIGFCPFHDDVNNPGLAVSPESIYEPSQSKGVWACWSCSARGDLFGFVMRMNDCSFTESIHFIAEIIGLDLNPYYRELSAEEELKEEHYAVIEQIAELFCEQLFAHPKKLEFFTKKGIGEEILRAFKVGYCPSLEFFNANVSAEVRNIAEPEIGNRQRLFGNRLVYPQFTTTGRIWGWYARQPDNRAEGIPKYVGTSQKASLFEGGNRLYGFHSARKLTRKSNLPIIIVEGFNDTLAAQQAHFPAIATCGTQLSGEQIKTLQLHSVRSAVVCYDPDDAGREGMLKIAERAHKVEGVQLKFSDVTLEPEEFIANIGADAFAEKIREALAPIDYIISSHSDFDASTPTKKRDFLNHIKPYLVLYPRRSLDRALGVEAVSRFTGLSQETIFDFLDETGENPLQNLLAEQIVLAELAINPASWVLLDVSRNDFSLKRYVQTYDLMRQLYEQEAEVNIELLLTHAQNTRSPVEIIETISKLSVVRRKTPEQFAKDIRDKSIRRQAEQLALTMTNQVRDLRSPVMESIGGFMQEMTHSINGAKNRDIYSSVDAIALTMSEVERRAKMDTEIAGLDLGPDWEWFIRTINGIQPERLCGIAAFSSVGKSVIAANWIHKLSIAETFSNGLPGTRCAGLVASLEMTVIQNIMRLAAIDSGIPHSYIDHARFETQEQIDLYFRTMDRIKSARLTWMTGNVSLKEIAMQARVLQSRGELDYILIDYIQLLDLTAYSDRWSVTEKYNQVSEDMKVLAKALKVPIIYCAQLNRSAAQEDIPTGANIGSAIKIYQDATNFLILAKREFGLLGSMDKNRDGESGGVVKLSFDKNMQTSTLRVYESEPPRSRLGQ